MHIIKQILQNADIQINGNRPGDIVVHNSQLFNRILSEGSLGLGESYMQGWWDCSHLDVFFYKILRSQCHTEVQFRLGLSHILSKLYNPQDRKKSLQVAEKHYNLGNDFYADMLDPLMQYTCGYWKNAKSLQKAQEQKLDLVCKKLGLKKGDTILELGGGFGGFAYYASTKYGCHVTSYNISSEQVKFAKNKTKKLAVDVIQKDYRDARGKFDYVVSIGMLEHVGPKNYDSFFQLVKRCLKEDGLCLIHTIGNTKPVAKADPWISKYIFPGGHLPAMSQVVSAAQKNFVIEDIHNFGAHYDKTLMAWYDNYKQNWHKYEKVYPEHFERMWDYYLLSCAGSFRARNIQLWQFVFSPKGMLGGYTSIR